MSKGKPSFNDLLTFGNRADLRGAITSYNGTLSLPQVHRLASLAASLEPTLQPLRLAVIHSYTSELLDPWFALAAALQGLKVETYHAPYGLNLQEAQASSGLVTHEPDLTLLLLTREDLHPHLIRPLAGFTPAQQKELAQEALDRLFRIVGRFRAHNVGEIVLTVLPQIHSPGLGIYDVQSERSESVWWTNLKSEIGRSLRESVPASLFLDLDEVLLQVGRAHFFDLRFWYSARYPFATDSSAEIARLVMAVGASIKFPKIKVIVLDADNTLWGGIIGEDGLNGVTLGPDYPGNAFVDFQRRLLDYQQRGLLLALCSKNNAADVDQVLEKHPHQLLRDKCFAAKRVNWLSKPDNLVSLSEELRLGLESFLVIDDSDHECAAVRSALPQVEVVQTPARPVDVPHCLDQVARLEVLSLTGEDVAKTELYAQERRRRESQQISRNNGIELHDHLLSLQMKMWISFNDSSHLARLAQLTQKTNQFNLTTHRYSEQQIQQFINDDNWLVAHFSLTDIFGNSGIVGLAIVHLVTPRQAKLDSFLMSCRVIGREAESAFLHALLRYLTEQGVNEVMASYRPTLKNVLAKDFLPHQGFQEHADGEYWRDLRRDPPQPETAFPIKVESEASLAR